MMIYFVLAGMAVSGAYVANQMFRHNCFMEALADAYKDLDVNVNSFETFKNFDNSKPWDYDFHSMIVKY